MPAHDWGLFGTGIAGGEERAIYLLFLSSNSKHHFSYIVLDFYLPSRLPLVYGGSMLGIRQTQTVELRIKITTKGGEGTEIKSIIKKSRLNKLGGNGLTAHNLYELQKSGKTISTDSHGTTFEFTVSEPKADSADFSND